MEILDIRETKKITKKHGCSILKIDEKYAISTEVQVIKNKDCSNWFGMSKHDSILNILHQYIVQRISKTLTTSNDLQIFEENDILVALKFHSYGTKDLVLLRKEQLLKMGLKIPHTEDSDGHYGSFILYPEKLIVIVAMKKYMSDFQNVTLSNTEASKIPNSDNSPDSKAILEKIRTETDDGPSNESFKHPIICNAGASNSADSGSVESLKLKLEIYKRKKPTPIRGTERNKSLREKGCSEHSTENVFDTHKPKSKGYSFRVRKHDASILELAGIEHEENSAKENLIPSPGSENSIDSNNNSQLSSAEARGVEAHAREESTSDEFQKNVQLKSAQPRKRKRQKRLTLQKSKKRQLTNNRSRPSETKSQDADETQDFNRKEPVMTMEKLLSKKKKSLDNLPVVEFDDMSYLETDVDETENVAQQNKSKIHALTLKEIGDLVSSLDDDIKNIFTGNTQCERHDQFKKGGKEKGCLNMQVAFGLFTEKQVDVVLQHLMKMFCTSHGKYFDYVMKVLLPETMAMVYGNIANISREEADRIIMGI